MLLQGRLWPTVAATVILVGGADGAVAGNGSLAKRGLEIDVRTGSRELAEDVLTRSFGWGGTRPIPSSVSGPVKLRGTNIQVNDGGLDNVKILPDHRPFVLFTQSETSLASFGRMIVAGYNSSAAWEFAGTGPGVFATQGLHSAYSVSSNGGKTWTSGFVPPAPGSAFTFGDPSLDIDRKGNFYYASIALDASGHGTVQVNTSEDGARKWGEGVVVQQDDGADKEWLAAGPDPSDKGHDNVYVTWTSFQPTGAELRFGRSTDGGRTWTAKTIFAPVPDPDPTHPQDVLQFSNPYVDQITGTLYVPFLHFSSSDADFIRVLVSDDGGDTFSFLNFNVAGAPDRTLLPVVSAGHLVDCGDRGGIRLAIHAGPNVGGRFGLPSYVAASRLVTQPAFAALNGNLYLAWAKSTSGVFGDPGSGSNVLLIRSGDGGENWTAPVQVNPPDVHDLHHVLPSVTLSHGGRDVHVAYYTQHVDGTVDVDLANSSDRGSSFASDRTIRVTGAPSVLPPTNVPLAPPSGDTYSTTNYDLVLRPCYGLGEYLSVRHRAGGVDVLWGDSRHTVTQPEHPLDPISGQTHPQTDVFFQVVKVK